MQQLRSPPRLGAAAVCQPAGLPALHSSHVCAAVCSVRRLLLPLATHHVLLPILHTALHAAVVSFLVFPVRARSLLERQMATTLIQIGDLTVWLVGQVCGTPAAAASGAVIRMQGSSGTDSKRWGVGGVRAVDDGECVEAAWMP